MSAGPAERRAPVASPPRPEDLALAGSGDTTTLVDLLDRVIDRGVVVQGDVILQVAGVDLVHVGLRVVLRGIDGPGGVR